jgi:hypothetical protein
MMEVAWEAIGAKKRFVGFTVLSATRWRLSHPIAFCDDSVTQQFTDKRHEMPSASPVLLPLTYGDDDEEAVTIILDIGGWCT